MKVKKLICLEMVLLTMTTAMAEENVELSDTLSEVVVSFEKPLTKVVGGRISYDVAQLIKGKAVTTVYDALLYLPGVKEHNDVLQLAGAQGVTILINSKKSSMSLSNMLQLLKSLPSSRLHKAEIMYSADPKYHTRGAAINIIMKEPDFMDGLRGQVNGTYQQKYYAEYFTGLSLQYALDGLTFDVVYNYGDIHYRTGENIYSRHVLDGNVYEITQIDRTVEKRQSHTPWANIGYQWGNGHKLNLTYNGSIQAGLDKKLYSAGTLSHSIQNKTDIAPTTMHNLHICYDSPLKLTIGSEFLTFRDSGLQHFVSASSDFISKSTQNIKRCKLYIDHTAKLKDYEFDYGMEFNYAKDNSSQIYYDDNHSNMNSQKDEYKVDTYVGLRRGFNGKYSVSASLTGEYYKIGEYDRWSIFPQLSVTYVPAEMHVCQINLSTDKVYPSYWEMHNSITYLNNYAELHGNPTLRPFDSYSGQISYIFRNKYVATLYVNYIDDYAVQLPYQSTERLALIFKTQNMDYERTCGINLYAPFCIGRFLNTTATVNLFNDRQKATHFHDIAFDKSKWILYSKLDNTFTVSSKPDIKAELSAAYCSPCIQGPGVIKQLFHVNAGVKMTLMQGNAELIMKCNDIFNSWTADMTMKYAAQDMRMSVFPDSRKFVMSFTYRFNGFKPKNSLIDTSRFGTK